MLTIIKGQWVRCHGKAYRCEGENDNIQIGVGYLDIAVVLYLGVVWGTP